MTTKTEMTLENVTLNNAAFMYIKGEQDSESIRKIYDEKVTDEINKIWWLNHHYYSLIHGILSPSMHEPNKHILSTSDYLLLLSAPESQAHLLTEKDLIVGNRFECIEDVVMSTSKKVAYRKGSIYLCENKHCITNEFNEVGHWWNDVNESLNRHFKLVSQPPVMEGEQEITVAKFLHKEIGYDLSKSATLTLEIKTLALLMGDYTNQKTCALQDEIKSLRYDLFHVTASEQSLQSEVEQLKGLLKEAQPFCGTMLRGKIEHYTSK